MIFEALLLLAQATPYLHPCPILGPRIARNNFGNYQIPKVLRKVQPEITGQARLAGIPPFTLVLKLVVPPEGPACNIQVVKPIGFGLDEAAVSAVRLWEFEAGTRGGEPIPMQVWVDVTFQNHGEGSARLAQNRKELDLAIEAIGSQEPERVANAVKTIQRLSRKYYGPAEAYLGLLLYEGEVIPKDYLRAVKLIRNANRKKIPYGIYAMGRLLSEGKAVKPNREEALRLLNEASYFNVAPAQVWLAQDATQRGDLEAAQRYLRFCADTVASCKADLGKLKAAAAY